MPRRTLSEDQPPAAAADLVARLAAELTSDRTIGQPLIYEQAVGSGRVRVIVVWDEWDQIAMEGRTAIILQAYAQTEGPAYRERVALATGLTVPEAHAAGLLPFHIITARRNTDPVSLEDCREAMIQIGASTLADPNYPQLRYATQEEAETARNELISLLPRSEPIWLVSHDVGTVADWIGK